eukprot:GHVH01017060.1.p1 GENE.GHVH01017060.1~~GHVH01017060.1.p1  ORF type:complete len:1118 (+),score=91.30 GHVH01017060.1:566-3919(+)
MMLSHDHFLKELSIDERAAGFLTTNCMLLECIRKYGAQSLMNRLETSSTMARILHTIISGSFMKPLTGASQSNATFSEIIFHLFLNNLVFTQAQDHSLPMRNLRTAFVQLAGPQLDVSLLRSLSKPHSVAPTSLILPTVPYHLWSGKRGHTRAATPTISPPILTSNGTTVVGRMLLAKKRRQTQECLRHTQSVSQSRCVITNLESNMSVFSSYSGYLLRSAILESVDRYLNVNYPVKAISERIFIPIRASKLKLSHVSPLTSRVLTIQSVMAITAHSKGTWSQSQLAKLGSGFIRPLSPNGQPCECKLCSFLEDYSTRLQANLQMLIETPPGHNHQDPKDAMKGVCLLPMAHLKALHRHVPCRVQMKRLLDQSLVNSRNKMQSAQFRRYIARLPPGSHDAILKSCSMVTTRGNHTGKAQPSLQTHSHGVVMYILRLAALLDPLPSVIESMTDFKFGAKSSERWMRYHKYVAELWMRLKANECIFNARLLEGQAFRAYRDMIAQSIFGHDSQSRPSKSHIPIIDCVVLVLIQMLYREVIVPFLRSAFISRRCQGSGDKVVIYRRCVFRQIQIHALRSLRRRLARPHTDELTPRFFSVPVIIPKLKGVRIILNMKLPRPAKLSSMNSIKQLTARYIYFKNVLELVASNVSSNHERTMHGADAQIFELHPILGGGIKSYHEFIDRVHRWLISLPPPHTSEQEDGSAHTNLNFNNVTFIKPLYIVKGDIRQCFDSMSHTAMFQTLERAEMLLMRDNGPGVYNLEPKIGTILATDSSSSNIRSTTITIPCLTHDSEKQVLRPDILPLFEKAGEKSLAERSNEKQIIIVSGSSCDESGIHSLVLPGCLTSQWTQFINRVGITIPQELKRYTSKRIKQGVDRPPDLDQYRLAYGIPQGTAPSSLLCDYYIGRRETQLLNEINASVTPEPCAGTPAVDLYMRWVDDFIFVSHSKQKAAAFVDSVLENGIKGMAIDRSKLELSFDHAWRDQVITGHKSITWLEMSFPSTLQWDRDRWTMAVRPLPYRIPLSMSSLAPSPSCRLAVRRPIRRSIRMAKDKSLRNPVMSRHAWRPYGDLVLGPSKRGPRFLDHLVVQLECFFNQRVKLGALQSEDLRWSNYESFYFKD